jgi:DNA-directed RNA polymerase subunit RPC12/RpoP
MQGKKIRCKGCGHTFAVPGEVTLEPEEKAKPQPAPVKAKAASGYDEDDDGNPYGLSNDLETIPRCPHCAKQMESAEAVVCLHCGYNIRLRKRVETKKVMETTAGDRIMWLLPGIGCVVLIIVLIIADILYMQFDEEAYKRYWWSFVGYLGFKVWGVIISLGIMFFAGKFAIRRLIFDSTPPEKVK